MKDRGQDTELKKQGQDIFSEADKLQQQASDPAASVWVGASAGAGKTKVLTDRVLRLLLPRPDGRPGTPPHKILALTFTRAAASEMALRIRDRLGRWAVMPDPELIQALTALTGIPPETDTLEAARRLFAEVVDAPGGLQIMTIHAFCQSVLGRFPLESGLPPHFTVLEDSQSAKLLEEAQNTVLARAAAQSASPLGDALHNLAAGQNADQFTDLIQTLCAERGQMNAILKRQFGPEGLYTELCRTLGIPPGKNGTEILRDACTDSSFNTSGLRRACTILAASSKVTDKNRAAVIENWLNQETPGRVQTYESYARAFLTDKDDIRKNLATKEASARAPDILDILQDEAFRLTAVAEQRKAAECAEQTRDLFLLGQTVLETYAHNKNRLAALDFDDLVMHTLNLLRGRTMRKDNTDAAAWVMFKLDRGIDHILVDEAQDTNPEQWEIIQALCEDFFSGQSASEEERTVFVVGDEKQSIFSFQRAAPEKFNAMRTWFANRIEESGRPLIPVDIAISFRSAPAILRAVDAVFADDPARSGVGKKPVRHTAFRNRQAGLVELWPLFRNAGPDTADPWAPPVETADTANGAMQMAEHIGRTIATWLESGERLESRGRAIQAGDIMILVRARTAFVGQLVRALKTRGIPVSGVDRMILKEQLAIQDLCAAAGFALLPDDDLTLACLLKSPLIGWNEDRLYALAKNRPSALWQAIKETGDSILVTWLESLIRQAGTDHPYTFFSRLLHEPCPADATGGLRAIQKRLGEDALDPLEEFLNTTLTATGQTGISTVQEFLLHHERERGEIKRQMEEGGNAVRIMTVHGAKGLQAPIVILPDTVRTAASRKTGRILWPDRSGADLPFFCQRREDAPPPCRNALENIQARLDEEYRRLFYVAMTRAEDRLYIGGYTGIRPPLEDSWYNYAATALPKMPDCHPFPFAGTNEEIQRIEDPKNKGQDIYTPKKGRDTNKKPGIVPPEWPRTAPPEDPNPPRPLMPSRPSQKEAPVLSPLAKDSPNRFRRGELTHLLLQLIPDLPEQDRESAAQKLAAQSAPDLEEQDRQKSVHETLTILNHPDFAAVFGPGSLAETAVSGLLPDGTLIAGRIDRLCITNRDILIVDYKTGRQPPTGTKNIPALYIRQMQAYKAALSVIYPDHNIRCALIWTDGPVLTPLD